MPGIKVIMGDECLSLNEKLCNMIKFLAANCTIRRPKWEMLYKLLNTDSVFFSTFQMAVYYPSWRAYVFRPVQNRFVIDLIGDRGILHNANVFREQRWT